MPTAIICLPLRESFTNAARHAKSPILAVTVELVGDRVEVAVVDQGPGIPAELVSSVFEWGAHGPHSPGQGIGLHVAQRLVSGMGGRLRIESDPDTGTRVVVSLSAVAMAHERSA